MNISLTKPLEDFVQNKVNTGMYASASEVIRAGLRALVEQELDRNINIGLEEANQGLGTEFNDKFAEKLVKKVQTRIGANQEK
jgi:antitoxin ParD1/3/4